jgi:hypothetical protein
VRDQVRERNAYHSSPERCRDRPSKGVRLRRSRIRGLRLADLPDWSSDAGKVRFDGAPTASGTEEVEISFAGIGNETIRVTAVTDATTSTIHGDLEIVIVGLASVSASFSLDK